MLAEPRARPAATCRTPSITIGEATVGIAPALAAALRQVDPDAARDHLRVGEDLVDRVDRPGRHADLLQRRQQVGLVP